MSARVGTTASSHTLQVSPIRQAFLRTSAKLMGGEQILGLKLARIQAIKNAGLSVLHVIHRHGMTDEVALEVEAALIDAYPGLTNVQGGRASSARGPMSAREILEQYALPEFPHSPEHRLMLININRIEDRSNRTAILNRVRYAWKVADHRIENVDYVLAVVRGVVIGAFKPTEWLEANPDNFPDIPYADASEPNRKGLEGKLPKTVFGSFT